MADGSRHPRRGVETTRGSIWAGRPARAVAVAVQAVLATVLLAGGPAWGQEDQTPTDAQPSEEMTLQPPAPTESDGPSYPISAFEIAYIRENPLHPPASEVMKVRIHLGLSTQGLIASRPDAPVVEFRLFEVAEQPQQMYFASAVQSILEQIRDHFADLGLFGLFVAPDPLQIDETGQDLREPGQSTLRIMVTTSVITELRTLASGDRIPPEERVNHPWHEKIRLRSPVQPYREGDEARQDLARKAAIDRYVFHLSRHPGRRVDVAVSAALEPGGGALDYLITENRPLVLYAQVSNTGTRSTNRWRERFGLYHTQLTNNDDVFELAYTTAGFDATHAVTTAYEAPFPDNDRMHWRLEGRWNEFTASDVGVFLSDFTGRSWLFGGEVSANIYQHREFFLDLFGGINLLDTRVSNPIVGRGQETFLLPRIGVRLERSTEWMDTTGSVSLEWQVGGVTGVESAQLDRLGRTSPDDDWAVLGWRFEHSVYLEPLIDRDAWEDPNTPRSSTLAHELAFTFRGQHAFDKRLIASLEQSMGGMHTVRGYPESVVAGDTALVGSLEYRFHVPRIFAIQPEPRTLFGQPFRAAPQHVYGRPDWDLVLKGFLDVGRTILSDRLPFEENETLVGAGIGVDLNYRRNVRLRLDWGFALQDLPTRNVASGANRAHIMATLLY